MGGFFVCFRRDCMCVRECMHVNLKHRLLASLCHHPHCSFMIDRVHLFPCSKLNYFAINSLLKIARLLNSEHSLWERLFMDRGQGDVLEYSAALPQISWMKMAREKGPIQTRCLWKVRASSLTNLAKNVKHSTWEKSHSNDLKKLTIVRTCCMATTCTCIVLINPYKKKKKTSKLDNIHTILCMM